MTIVGDCATGFVEGFSVVVKPGCLLVGVALVSALLVCDDRLRPGVL